MPTKKITKLNPKGTLISRVVVVKWTPWKDGKTPIAGEDYKIPDRWEDGYTPIKWVDYFDGQDGYTPTTDDLLALILPNIPEPIPWKDWKDWIDGENVPEEKIYEMVEKVVGTIEVPTIEIWEDRNGQWIEKDWKKTYIKSVTNIWAWMSTWVVDFIALRDTPSSYAWQAGKVATVNAWETGLEFTTGWGGGGSGTVTSVSVTTANWVSGSVATPTTTPAISLTLWAITPTSVAASGTVTGSNLSNTNTWDNAVNSLYSGLVSNATHTGDATGATALTLATVNSNVGSFTNANITVNAKGLITAASNGSGWGGSPGGSTTQVQFNDGGVFAWDAWMTYDKTLNQLSVPRITSHTGEHLEINPANSNTNTDLYLNSWYALSGDTSCGNIEIWPAESSWNADGWYISISGHFWWNTGGNGWSVSISAWSAQAWNGNGGDLGFSGGTPDWSGTSGRIIFYQDGNALGGGILDFSVLSADKTFTFPNATGTLNVWTSGSFSQAWAATTDFTVTIGATQANTNYKVNITPTAALSAALFYISAKTTTTFTVTYLTGLTWTVTFDWLLTA